MYHGATRNGASVQLDDGRLMEKAGQGTTAPATMMEESGSATRPCRAVQCDSAGLHAGESVVCMGRWPSRRSARPRVVVRTGGASCFSRACAWHD